MHAIVNRRAVAASDSKVYLENVGYTVGYNTNALLHAAPVKSGCYIKIRKKIAQYDAVRSCTAQRDLFWSPMPGAGPRCK